MVVITALVIAVDVAAAAPTGSDDPAHGRLQHPTARRARTAHRPINVNDPGLEDKPTQHVTSRGQASFPGTATQL